MKYDSKDLTLGEREKRVIIGTGLNSQNIRQLGKFIIEKLIVALREDKDEGTFIDRNGQDLFVLHALFAFFSTVAKKKEGLTEFKHELAKIIDDSFGIAERKKRGLCLNFLSESKFYEASMQMVSKLQNNSTSDKPENGDGKNISTRRIEQGYDILTFIRADLVSSYLSGLPGVKIGEMARKKVNTLMLESTTA